MLHTAAGLIFINYILNHVTPLLKVFQCFLLPLKKKFKPTGLAFKAPYDLAQWFPVSSVIVSPSCLCPRHTDLLVPPTPTLPAQGLCTGCTLAWTILIPSSLPGSVWRSQPNGIFIQESILGVHTPYHTPCFLVTCTTGNVYLAMSGGPSCEIRVPETYVGKSCGLDLPLRPYIRPPPKCPRLARPSSSALWPIPACPHSVGQAPENG